MPPVDLDSLVSVCGGGGADNKISCETLAEDAAATANPDLPPDSFWLSKDAELDWFDRNAFFDRKDSTKGAGGGGGGGSISNSTNLSTTASVSQRFSINLSKSKTSIFGLPKPQKLQVAQVCRRTCRPPNVRLFPKRPAPAASAPVAVAEPSSPKVSCMGRVRSKKDRSRRSRNRPHVALEALRKKEKTGRIRRPGLWTSLTGLFRSVSKTKPLRRDDNYLPAAVAVAAHGSLSREREFSPRRSTGEREFPASMSDFSDSGRPSVGTPGLGRAMRFSSGRRSESWVVVDDADASRVEEAGTASDRDPVWGRRGMGPLELDEVQCRRQWENMGPSTV